MRRPALLLALACLLSGCVAVEVVGVAADAAVGAAGIAVDATAAAADAVIPDGD